MLLAAESTLLLESIIKLARIFLVRHTYAKFTLHYFSPIFHSPTGFDESPTNARHLRQIGARSRE